MDKPDEKILNRAIAILAGVRVQDGEPYLPSNGTEGTMFEEWWCAKCRKDNFEAGGDSCPILNKALIGEQPKQWQYWNNKPVCTAFAERVRKYKKRSPKKKSTLKGDQLTIEGI